MTSRRHILAALGAIAAAPSLRAQAAWPDKPIRFVVGFPPGGNIDYLARIVAGELASQLKQPVVVESIIGAGGNLATQAMVRSPADGHTIGFAPITMATNPSLMKTLGYDPLTDVTMVGQMSVVPVVVLVGGHTQFRSLSDLVAGAKARPGQASFGHGGHGTTAFLGPALFERATGAKFLHVSFRGAGPILQAMIGGHIDGFFAVSDASLPSLIAEGRVRALGVMQEARVALLPAVPTAREQGFSSTTDISSWHGIMVRSGTPASIVARLHTEITMVVRSQKIGAQIAKAALEPRTSASPAAFDAFYRSEMKRWNEVITHAGVVAE